MKKRRFAPKLKIKEGDTVVVLTGDYKGVKGKVLEVFPQDCRAIVEDVNLRKKHRKPTNDKPGGIVEISAPIHISNLALVDPKSGEATRVGRRVEDEKIVRYAKKSGETVK